MQNLNQEVQIMADDMGNVINQSQNPEYGYIRLSQNKVVITNGFVDNKVVSTLLPGKLEALQSLNITKDTKLGGKIKVIESLEGADRDLKMAGKTGVVCRVLNQETGEEQPIYRKTVFTADVNAQDIFIDHTNGAEIKEANLLSVGDETMTKATKEEAFEVEDEAEEVNSETENEDVEVLEEEFQL